MKKLLTAAACLCISAAPAYRYQAESLIKQEVKLNSGGRMGGSLRQEIELDIPAGVDYVYYGITTSPKGPLEDLGLTAQLHKQIKEQGVKLSIGAALLNSLIYPTSDGAVDAYIMDAANAANFTAQTRHVHTTYMPDCSRANLSSGIIGIPIKYSKEHTVLYLCLHNPSAVNAVFVNVGVVAMKRL